MEPREFSVRTQHGDGVTRVIVAGELDLATSVDLDRVVEDAIDEPHDVVIDLTDVDFLDSSALRVLVVRRRQRTDAGKRLILHAPSENVRRVVEMAGLETMFEPDGPRPGAAHDS